MPAPAGWVRLPVPLLLAPLLWPSVAASPRRPLTPCAPPSLSQTILPPLLSNCGSYRSVVERSPTGTFVGSALLAATTNVGTTITWAFVSPPVGLPFSIGLCDGQLKVLSAVSWAAAQSWTFTVQATNNGAA